MFLSGFHVTVLVMQRFFFQWPKHGLKRNSKCRPSWRSALSVWLSENKIRSKDAPLSTILGSEGQGKTGKKEHLAWVPVYHLWHIFPILMAANLGHGVKYVLFHYVYIIMSRNIMSLCLLHVPGACTKGTSTRWSMPERKRGLTFR